VQFLIYAVIESTNHMALLGFSRTTISRVYKEWREKGKTSTMQQ